MKIDGGCHCGVITFEGEIDPEKVGICHCADCQTAEICTGHPADFDLGKTQVVDPRRADYGETDHDRVASQRHVNAYCQGAPVVELRAVMQQFAIVVSHPDLPLVVIISV